MTHIATSYDEHRLYLYSGLSNIALNEIVEMYIQDENGEVSWDPQLVQVNTKSHRSSNKHEKATFNDPTLKRGRFGATVISYNEQDPYNSQVKRQVIYYYGGGQMYNEQIQQREWLDQIIRYVPYTREFKTVKQYGKVHDARRYHTAWRIGNYMIVHGGVNNFGKILEDVSWFDLILSEWKEIKVVKNSINKWINNDPEKYYDKNSDRGLGPQFYHKCAPIFYSQREQSWEEYLEGSFLLQQPIADDSSFGIDSDDLMKDLLIQTPDIKWDLVDDYLYQEGIYFFGGKSLLGKLNNELWCLKLWNKEDINIALEIDYKKSNSEKWYKPNLDISNFYAFMQWELIVTEGKPPQPRYQHCMHYCKPINWLCIFGGWGNKKDASIMNDLHLLRMDNMLWIEVEVLGMPLGKRGNFSSWVIQSKLIIFGGVKENMSSSNDSYVIEFDQDKVENILRQERESQERARLEAQLFNLKVSS